jgi:hypothetical protein
MLGALSEKDKQPKEVSLKELGCLRHGWVGKGGERAMDDAEGPGTAVRRASRCGRSVVDVEYLWLVCLCSARVVYGLYDEVLVRCETRMLLFECVDYISKNAVSVRRFVLKQFIYNDF